MKQAHIDATIRALTALIGAHHCRLGGETTRPDELDTHARGLLAELVAEVHGVTPDVVTKRIEAELGRQFFPGPWQVPPPAAASRAGA